MAVIGAGASRFAASPPPSSASSSSQASNSFLLRAAAGGDQKQSGTDNSVPPKQFTWSSKSVTLASVPRAPNASRRSSSAPRSSSVPPSFAPQATPVARSNGHAKKAECCCIPTQHPGSFRCRLHRSTTTSQKRPLPAKPTPALGGAKGLVAKKYASSAKPNAKGPPSVAGTRCPMTATAPEISSKGGSRLSRFCPQSKCQEASSYTLS